MTKFRLTNKAIDDLSEIWNYTFDYWSEHQADIYYKLLIENCREIANRPNLGKNYDGILNRLLGLRAGRHIIFYRELNSNEVEITRILHERMDLKTRILE